MTEAAGNYDKFVGRVQERYGDKKEDVLKWTNEWFDRQKTQSGSQR